MTSVTPIITGSIYLTSDINMIANNINTSKVINITENGVFLDHPNSIKATILLPTIDGLMADTDNDINSLRAIYWNYFLSDEPTTFMALICTVLNKGVNIFMYIPQSELKEFSYPGLLLEFIRVVYGLCIGTPNNQFMFDLNYTQYIADLLFNNNLLEADKYLLYSDIYKAPMESIVKLDQVYNPYIPNKNIESIREYFSHKGTQCIRILREDEKYDIIRDYECSSICK